MRSDRYVHPEFGLLSPMPRLRRELRMAFFSVLFGIGIGAATMIALSGKETADDAPVAHAVGSASVMSEDRTEPAPGIEKERNKEHTGKLNESAANANSENHKTNATTTCDGNSSCGNIPPGTSKPRAMRMPAANDAPAIGRAPLGRPSAEMAPVAPTVSSERAQSTAGASEEVTADPGVFKPIMGRKPHKSARIRPRERAANYRDPRHASQIGRAYERPGGGLDRAYALDRSYGSRGFWDWSR